MSEAGLTCAISDEEADVLLAPLRGRPIALAVSGGPDSMALMLLVARRLGRDSAEAGHAPSVIVLTVDHGLRAQSGAEASLVAREAARLGLGHRTLVWSGLKPASGLAEAAREARYGLLAEAIDREFGAAPRRALVTAHHGDDQVETFLMRLARGSGAKGLAAMRPASTWHPRERRGVEPAEALTILRPLLDVPRARLRATVEAAGVPFVTDPTNADHAYERPRMRAVAESLALAGIGAQAIGTSVRRLARAEAALEEMTRAAVAEHVAWHHGAFALIAAEAHQALAPEIRIRVIAEMVRSNGAGEPELVQLEALEAELRRRLAAGAPWRATLGGAVVAVRRAKASVSVAVWREAGRRGLPEADLAPGASIVWDGRFRLTLGADAAGPVHVRALAADDWRALQSARPALQRLAIPTGAALALPALYRDAALLAAPVLTRLLAHLQAGGSPPVCRDGSGVACAFVRPSDRCAVMNCE